MTFHTVGSENNKSGINNCKCCNLIPPHYYSNENLVEIFLINDSKEIWHFGTWKTEFLKSKIKSPISTSAFVNNSFFKNPHNCQSNENLVEKKRLNLFHVAIRHLSRDVVFELHNMLSYRKIEKHCGITVHFCK